MCQSRAEGGRRCAVHHPATLAMKFLVRNYPKVNYPLEQGQTDFLFKRLREEGIRRHTPSPERYREFFENMRTEVENDPDLSQTKKDRIVGKIDRALESDQMPDGRTFYALTHMTERASETRHALVRAVRTQAELTGHPQSRVRRQLGLMYNNIVTNRNAEDPDGLLDSKTIEALDHLRNNVELRFEENPRITRESTGQQTIVAQGYDPADGRLEVEMSNGSVYAFHSVSQETYDRFRSRPSVVFHEIRTGHNNDYTSRVEAERDAYRLWCDHCERFHVASGHNCPGREGRVTGRAVRHDVDEIYGRVVRHVEGDNEPGTVPTVPSWRNPSNQPEEVELSSSNYERSPGAQGRTPSNAKMITPKMDKVMEKIREGKAVTFKVGRRIYVRGTGRHEYNDVTTTVTAKLADGNYRVGLTYDANNVECTCEVYQNNRTCTHVRPSGASRINRFVREDITNAINQVQGRYGDLMVAQPDAYSTVRTYVVPEGDEITRGGERTLTEEQVNGVLYDLIQRQDAAISIVYPSADPENEPASVAVSIQNRSVRYTATEGALSSRRIGTIRRAIESQLTPAIQRTQFMQDRLRNQSNRVVSTGWEVNQQSRENYMSRFRNVTDGYIANPDQFLDDYRAALTPAVRQNTFMAGSVTGGNLSNRSGRGRGFGIEIEVDGGSSAVSRIADRLRTEGLATYHGVAGYHQRNDFRHWRVERDGSVSGEIVSPVLYDNEDSWEQVRRVCEIARDCGGRATARTGNHVHIGAAGLSVQQRRGVFAAVVANQDVIRRLSTNPSRGSHRTSSSGNSYTNPFSDRDIQNAYAPRPSYYYSEHTLGQDRYRMANFYSERTIEFRDPDGSLDPAHIQANVMMAAALTSAGEHGNWSDLAPATVHSQRVGANALRQPYIQSVIENEDERILAENISLMTTLDALFPEREQRQRILGVITQNPWQQQGRY